ncbi:MAG: hypothetical protein U0401_32290 [Anaerolineae bacterium]
MAGRQGFYLGVTLGRKGIKKMVQLFSAAKRKSEQNSEGLIDSGSPQILTRPAIKITPVSELTARPTAKLITPTASDICTGCSMDAGSKSGSWYAIGEGKYCQDCGPAAAREAQVDIVAPVYTLATPGNGSAYRTSSNSNRREALPLKPLQTRTMMSKVAVALGETSRGVVDHSLVLLREGRDGYEETGLAVTPAVVASKGPEGDIELREDLTQWGIVHTLSGRMVSGRMVNGSLRDGWPYQTPEEATFIASVLARQDWTRDLSEITADQVAQKEATLNRYHEVLGEEDRITQHDPARKDQARAQTTTGVTSYSIKTRLPDESIEGELVCVPQYGGISRVISDEGDILFLVDSVGQRYEVSRDQARKATELDFRSSRIAMPVDPGQEAHPNCANCQRSPGAVTEEYKQTWYKMAGKTFCGTCVGDYALAEDYMMPEEINTDLPQF